MNMSKEAFAELMAEGQHELIDDGSGQKLTAEKNAALRTPVTLPKPTTKVLQLPKGSTIIRPTYSSREEFLKAITLKSRQAPEDMGLEEDEQAAVIRWAKRNTDKYPELRWLHSSLNGVPLGFSRADFDPTKGTVKRKGFSKTAMRAKRGGMVAGIPDLTLPKSRGGYGSLVIEMKSKKNKPTAEQEDALWFYHREGHKVWVCYGHVVACAAILEYLTLPESGIYAGVSG